MTYLIKGLWTALATPFVKEVLDEEGLRRNLRLQQEAAVDGILALGTTGEAPTLTMEESEKILSICKETLIPLMVGTGTNSTRTTIERTQWAYDHGADYALVVTPYYNKPPQEGILAHFLEVATYSPLPIVVYNHRGRTGVNIETSTLKRIAEHPKIISVKDASGDINQIMQVIQQIPKLSVMSGDDALTYATIKAGGQGVISVASNAVPELMKRLVNGEYEIHKQMAPVFEALSLETNPIPIKGLMDILGMAAGQCRLPLIQEKKETREKLKWSIEMLMSLS